MNLLFLVFGTVCLGLGNFTLGVPPPPVWPVKYRTCVSVETPREFIKAGWYVDEEQRRIRLDSYGIPKGMNESIARLLQYYMLEVEDFDYACSQFGPPLYEFIYHYDEGRAYTLFPQPDPPYRGCTVQVITSKFPNSPLLPEVEFIEESKDNITSFYHWRAESFLFTLDYLFHTQNGLPYKLYVNADENVFLSFYEGELDEDTFYPPPGVTCKPV
ncbi:hypothetical protein ACJMK2_029365 [Sinanodonta woodiana]|uniref:Uncharacterized protein n=1 Tax=Sinanodonta woodiana TaxID=1069815 RepID=A0ABD3XDK7_SINWO